MSEKKNDLSRAFSEDGALKTHIGGQALLEGVMMRGKFNWAVAVRQLDNVIYTEEHDLASGKKKNGWLYWPVVRGCRAFVESLVLGYKALSVAVEHTFVDAEPALEEPSDSVQSFNAEDADAAEGASVEAPDSGRFAPASAEARRQRPALNEALDSSDNANEFLEEPSDSVQSSDAEGASSEVSDSVQSSNPEPALSSMEMALSMGLGLLLGVVLFVVAPAFITNLFVGEYDSNTLAWNVVDGILRIAVFVFYIWLIGRMEDIKRMFAYHGAEHKIIHCYEHGLPLTPENARQFPCLHVRCGTAFLIMVMIIAIFVYTVTPLNALIAAWGVPDGAPKLALVILVRILLMPIIAGLAYEVTVRWAGTHPEMPLVKVILWPGLQMQRLTTRKPGDAELECAIAAMKLVLEREEAEARAAARVVE